MAKKISPSIREAIEAACSLDWTMWQIVLTIQGSVRLEEVPKMQLFNSSAIDVGVESRLI